MTRLLASLAVLLAVLGAAWMIYDAGFAGDDNALDRGDDGEDEFLAEADEILERRWDEAPRLAGAPGARVVDPTAAGAGVAGGGSMAAGVVVPGALVRFGGTVTSTDGQRVSGVKVQITSKAGAAFTAETKEDGRFAFEVSAGRYDILLQREGVGGLALSDYMVDGATGIDLEFQLEAMHALEFQLDREGRPVAGARVDLTPRSGPGGASMATDDLGQATFPELVSGRYNLLVTDVEGEDIRRRVDLRKDVELKIDLPRGVAVHGKVSSAEDGTFVEGARVAVSVRLPAGVWVTSMAETDVNGDYEVTVPQGTVGRFAVTAEIYAPWPPRKQISRVLKRFGGVKKGQAVQYDVTLTRGLYLTGTVKDPDGKPVPGIDLHFRTRRGVALTAGTSADGEYVIAGISADRYDVVVLSDGWFTESALRVRVPNLEPGEEHEYDVTVHPTITVQGEVVHKGGKPATGARVWITGGGRLLRAAHNAGRDLETFSDANGNWRIGDLPPNQGVAARASLGTLEARPRGFRTNAPPDAPLRLVLAPTVTMRGRVVDLTTRGPVPTARVIVRPQGAPSGRMRRTVLSDASGEFVVEELIPGAWDLTPSKSGYLVAEARREVLDKQTHEVQVEVFLDPGLVIGGYVGAQGGRPIKNAIVNIWGVTRAGKSARRTVRTGSNGTFRTTGWEAGAYTVRAKYSGYRNAVLKDLQGGESRITLTMVKRPPKAP